MEQENKIMKIVITEHAPNNGVQLGKSVTECYWSRKLREMTRRFKTLRHDEPERLKRVRKTLKF